MNYRRWLLASLLCLLLLGLGTWWALPTAPPPAVPTGARAAPAAVNTPSAAPPAHVAERPREPRSTRAWVPGVQFTYELDAEQRIAFEQKGAKSGAPVRLTLQGELTLAMVGGQGDRLDAQLQVRPSRFTFDSDGADALDANSRQQMLASIQMPFYVTFTRQGAALLAHFERGVDPVTQNLLRSLVASTQFVTPVAPQESWQSQELDTTGQFVATYRPAGGVRRFEKSKERYLRVASAGGLRPLDADMRITVDATASFGLGEEGWPESVQSREHVVVESGRDMPTVLGDAQVRLTRRSVRNVPALIGSLEVRRQQLGTTSMAALVHAPEDPRAELRRLVAGARFSDLVGALRALPRDEKVRGPATAQLMNRLKALFTLEPDAAAQVPALLREEKDRNTYSSLIGALSAASTPEAVRALAEVAGDARVPVPTRVDAIAGLGMAEHPTPEGLSELRQLTQAGDVELDNTATLALGNAARNLHEQKSPEAEALLRELAGSVPAAATPEARALQLRALGNTAQASALPALQEALRDPSPVVREAAIEALRLIPSPVADQLLVGHMVEDPAPQVRRAAIFASSFRPLTPYLPALERTLRTDAVEAVRGDVVRLLGGNLAQLAGASDLLAWAGQNDPSGDIRHTALAFLAPRTRSEGP